MKKIIWLSWYYGLFEKQQRHPRHGPYFPDIFVCPDIHCGRTVMIAIDYSPVTFKVNSRKPNCFTVALMDARGIFLEVEVIIYK